MTQQEFYESLSVEVKEDAKLTLEKRMNFSDFVKKNSIKSATAFNILTLVRDKEEIKNDYR